MNSIYTTFGMLLSKEDGSLDFSTMSTHHTLLKIAKTAKRVASWIRRTSSAEEAIEYYTIANNLWAIIFWNRIKYPDTLREINIDLSCSMRYKKPEARLVKGDKLVSQLRLYVEDGSNLLSISIPICLLSQKGLRWSLEMMPRTAWISESDPTSDTSDQRSETAKLLRDAWAIVDGKITDRQYSLLLE